MNTVVWILMAISSHDWVSPSIEFTTEAKCVAAVQQIRVEARKRDMWSDGYCLKVEK